VVEEGSEEVLVAVVSTGAHSKYHFSKTVCKLLLYGWQIF